MFGPRLSRVFASRGHALWWSAMVLITAYCVAIDPPAEVVRAPDAVDAAKSEPKPADPWAHIDDAGQNKAEKAPEDTWASMKEAAKTRKELLP